MAEESDIDSAIEVEESSESSESLERVGSPEAEKDQTEQGLITYLFEEILNAIASWDVFLNDTGPTLFLVYAHESKIGEARAEISEQLITWLNDVRAKLRSDKSPLGMELGPGTSMDSNEDAAENILSNQFCLLPLSSYEKSVGKVIVCCSETLWEYYKNCLPGGSLQEYPKEVKEAYFNFPDKLKQPRKLHSKIEQVVEKHMGNPDFHHVLTELVFLDIRKQDKGRDTGVVTIILNGASKRYTSLPGLIEGTNLWINFDPGAHTSAPISTSTCRPLHYLFFKLLKRLLPNDGRVIKGFKTCYKDCAHWLDKRTTKPSHWSKKRLRREFEDFVHITKLNVLRKLNDDSSAYGRTHMKKGAVKGLWHVPFDRNRNFVGRETALGQLSRFFSSEEYCESAAVFGLGGMGKTQVALEFAYQKRQDNKDCSIFWVPAVNTTSFMEAYRKIGEKLEIPQIEEMAADATELVKAVKEKLSDESSGHWLLVFDNVDIFDVRDEEENKVTITGSLPLLDCLPSSHLGTIIFTTRNRKAAYDLAGKNIVEVKAMDLVEAGELLGSLVPEKLLGKDKPIVNKLLELLTCLPLAITQAGAYMSKENTTTSEYIGFYEQNEKEALALLDERFRDEASNPSNKDFKDGGGYKSIRDPVARTWRISFDQIRRKDELAAEYLSSMACLFHQNIPKSLLSACSSDRKAGKAIATLMAYSFVSERNSGESYDMHPLVHLVTQDWLRETNSLDFWTKQTISRIADVFPSEGFENRAIWTELLPHAIHALHLPRPPDADKSIEVELLRKVGWCLEINGEYKKASEVAEREINLRKELVGESDQRTLATMCDLGILLNRLGEYDKAKKWLSRAIELRKAVPGSEDKDTLTAMSFLAQVLSNQGKLSEAAKLNHQVLARREILLGPEDLDTLTSRSKLAAVLSMQGNYSEAEEMHRLVLQSREELLDPEDADILTSKIHLASVLMSQKKYDEAEAIYRVVLKLDQEKDGDDHPNTLSTMNSLGSLLHFQGRNEEAEELLRRTLDLREQKLGRMHHHTLLSMSNLALVLNSLCNYKEAEERQTRALNGFNMVLGKNHPIISTAIANLACIYASKGKRKEARELITQAIEKTKVDTGETHPDTLASLNNMVSIYLDRGELEEAEKLGVQVLEMARHELGEQHCHTLDGMANLTHLKQKRLTKAEELLVSGVNPRKRAWDDADAENSDEGSKKAKSSLAGLEFK